MELDDEAIREFQGIYAKDFGEELPLDEARVMATKLLTLYLALARKVPSSKSKEDHAA